MGVQGHGGRAFCVPWLSSGLGGAARAIELEWMAQTRLCPLEVGWGDARAGGLDGVVSPLGWG